MTKLQTDHHLLGEGDSLPPLQSCILDLEGTLFYSAAFKKGTLQQAVACIANKLSLPTHSAEHSLHSARKALAMKVGYEPSLSATVCSFGISLDEWAIYQSRVGIEKTIDRDEEIRRAVSHLYSAYSVSVYTNMNTAMAQAALSYLGILDGLRNLITPQVVGHTKPSPEAVDHLIARGVFFPRTTVAIGDRYSIDIQPITAVGGWGYLTKSRGDLLSFLKRLISLEA